MGWLLCLAYIICYVFTAEYIFLIVAGLFAISGLISEVASAIKKIFVIEEKEE